MYLIQCLDMWEITCYNCSILYGTYEKCQRDQSWKGWCSLIQRRAGSIWPGCHQFFWECYRQIEGREYPNKKGSSEKIPRIHHQEVTVGLKFSSGQDRTVQQLGVTALNFPTRQNHPNFYIILSWISNSYHSYPRFNIHASYTPDPWMIFD